jgi:hypothetical protein
MIPMLNHGGTINDSVEMTQSLQIVGTSSARVLLLKWLFAVSTPRPIAKAII